MVEIVEYDAAWPDAFAAIAGSLRAGLGKLALRIDHIGSTSVPGLAAKDVIDVQISVTALDERVTAAMEGLGYLLPEGVWRDHRPPGFGGSEGEWEKLYFRAPAALRRTHTHVRVMGRANQRYALLFRDYLRDQPAAAEAYARLKRQLALHLAEPAMYSEVKDPAVDLIYLAAEAWATWIHWQPGPSDA